MGGRRNSDIQRVQMRALARTVRAQLQQQPEPVLREYREQMAHDFAMALLERGAFEGQLPMPYRYLPEPEGPSLAFLYDERVVNQAEIDALLERDRRGEITWDAPVPAPAPWRGLGFVGRLFGWLRR